jgi:radical SAM superfamily enzyme YgiQ (UPF0313 family)
VAALSEVLVGQSYFLRFDPKLWEAMEPYPPLGSLYAAAVLRERGFDVAVFDAMLAESENDWERRVAEERPRFAVLFEDSFNYLSKMCLLRMREAALRMIGAAKARGAIAVVCGSDASDRADIYLSAGADFVAVGEGEISVAELLEHLRERPDASPVAVPGLRFGTGPGAVTTTPRPVLRDLDSLPEPARDLIDIERYREIWKKRHGYFSMNIATTRGCPFHCNWCAKPIWGQRYSVRSARSVAAEFAQLSESYGVDHIWFADDIMGLQPGWLGAFSDQLRERKSSIPFKCLSRADLLLRDGEIEALAQSGCEVVWIGAESGSQKILDAMDKGTRVEQIREVSARLHAAGVGVGFFLQFGYPGEGMPEIRQTLRLIKECAPDEIGMSVSYPLPGTRFYQSVRDQLGAKQNWTDSSDLAMMYDGPFSTAFYRQLAHVTSKSFRMRGALRRRRIRDTRPGWRRLAAALYHAMTLPVAWLRLEWLRVRPHEGIDALPPTLSREQAAAPTPQS